MTWRRGELRRTVVAQYKGGTQRQTSFGENNESSDHAEQYDKPNEETENTKDVFEIEPPISELNFIGVFVRSKRFYFSVHLERPFWLEEADQTETKKEDSQEGWHIYKTVSIRQKFLLHLRDTGRALRTSIIHLARLLNDWYNRFLVK